MLVVVNNQYRILIRKPVGRRPLGIPRCRWEDSIKEDVKEIGHDFVLNSSGPG
jgi:hypothetical protein